MLCVSGPVENGISAVQKFREPHLRKLIILDQRLFPLIELKKNCAQFLSCFWSVVPLIDQFVGNCSGRGLAGYPVQKRIFSVKDVVFVCFACVNQLLEFCLDLCIGG